MDKSELESLLKEISDRLCSTLTANEKTVGNTNTAGLLHGAGGIFSTPGLDRDVITAHMRPEGLLSVLPVFPTIYTDPRFPTITGFTADVGSEPTYPCSDAPYNFMKGCNLRAQFGRIKRDTATIEVDTIIRQLNRGEMTDLIMHGRLLAGNSFTPDNLDETAAVNLAVMSNMVGVGVAVERKLSTMLWTGNPANNNAGGGYAEFPGLDNQVATGQVDADTGTLCPALDSDVKDFNYDAVCGSTGRDIVEYVTMLEFYLRNNAEKMGLAPTEWVVVMRPELWYSLSACWPCQYNTNRCTSHNSKADIVVDGGEMQRLTDDMRTGKYLDVNGNRYRVVTDTGIYEQTNITTNKLLPGEYASSLYFVPLTITGGFPVAYLEHMDYRKIAPELSILGGAAPEFWTDGGKYLWAYEQNNFCFKLVSKIEPRVVLRAPHLAGKIQNIKYSPLQHLRDVDPSSPYWKDGGVSLRSGLSGKAVWGNK